MPLEAELNGEPFSYTPPLLGRLFEALVSPAPTRRRFYTKPCGDTTSVRHNPVYVQGNMVKYWMVLPASDNETLQTRLAHPRRETIEVILQGSSDRIFVEREDGESSIRIKRVLRNNKADRHRTYPLHGDLTPEDIEDLLGELQRFYET